jgi:hypothetical protein
MPSSTDCAFSPNYVSVWSEEHGLLALQMRVSAEFREMPCLTLTLAQAARLFSIDAARCERVLSALVDRGVLATDGRTFARADSGRRRA